MSKSLVRATAIAVCFAFLMLSFPGLIQAKPRNSRIDFRWFEKPALLLVEFINFLPIYTIPGYAPIKGIPVKTIIKKSGSKIKITGGLSSHRPSRDD